jgi:menaquinone-dependent protoporphyrinogen oxidase
VDEEVMSVRTLVTYASKHGSTREIAQAIGCRLTERGLDVEVRPVGEAGDVAGFGAVVLGSAVYLGSWRKEAGAFLERNRATLREIPVWLFSSGPIGDDPKDEPLTEKQRRQLEAVGARSHRVFGGTLDADELGFLERTAIRAAKLPVGDYRSWDDIQRWADEIADALGVAQVR